MKNLIFIGQFVSVRESYLDERISQAANNYQLKLLRLIDPDKSISLVPTFFRSDSNLKSYDDSKISYLYRNHNNNKLIEIILNSWKSFRLVKKNKSKNVLFYNLTTANILSFLSIRFLSSKSIFIIVADYHTPNAILQNLFKWCINRSNGCIVLNQKVSKELSVRSVVLPGILEENSVKLGLAKLNKNVLFSGSIGKTTGFELALKFAKEHSEFNLYITGRNYSYTEEELDNLLKEYDRPNIFYLGMLEYFDYQLIMEKCSIAFSFRNPNDVEHDFNFPSKILEYLSHGLFVISTKAYAEIEDDFYSFSEYSTKGVKASIDHFASLPDLKENRKQLKNYLSSNFSKESLISKLNILMK